jgi:hypothetical protein
MMPVMKQSWLKWCCRWMAIVTLALSPATARAADDGEDSGVYDARLEGYNAADKATLPGGGHAGAWAALIALTILAGAGLFKDAKRSHLD